MNALCGKTALHFIQTILDTCLTGQLICIHLRLGEYSLKISWNRIFISFMPFPNLHNDKALHFIVTSTTSRRFIQDDPGELVQEKHLVTHTLSLQLLYNIFNYR